MVIQRFGPSVIGGAESYAQDLAGQIHDQLGRDVHVYTTCAESHLSWANDYPAGDESASFGKILRFRTWFRRWPGFGVISRCLIALRRGCVALKLPQAWIKALESIWFLAQGPYTPSLIKTLEQKQDQYECVLAMTYLYWPTLTAVERLKIRKIMIPLAHDETPFYFDRVRQALERSDCILSNVVPEARLIKKVAPRSKVSVAGAGIKFTQFALQENTKDSNQKPYLLYLGRISRGKGVDQLIKWMGTKQLRAFNFELILAGHLEPDLKELANLPHVTYAGHVSPEEKSRLISNAFAVVNPSSHESLSLITLEALALGIPVLVNQQSEVLDYYSKEVPTCFGFGDQSSLAIALTELSEKSQSSDWRRQVERAREWTYKNFDWTEVVGNFELAIMGELYQERPFD